jgi:hypothetical protein
MAGERITVQVESNIGEEGPLTVMDALHQFMDAFELLGAAIGAEAGNTKIKWRLVALSKSSPATAVAEAFSVEDGVELAGAVHRGVEQFHAGLEALEEGEVSDWLKPNLYVAKQFYQRNLNGIGKTVVAANDSSPRSIVVEKVARKSLAAIEAYEAEQRQHQDDKSRSEWGSVDGHVTRAATWYGKPALYIRERLSNSEIPCVLTDEAAAEVGPTHSWSDAWRGSRVRARGQVFYDVAGKVTRVAAHSIKDVSSKEVNLQALRGIDILRGQSPAEHLRNLWGYPDE